MPSTTWQKSSYSGSGGDCVEVRITNGSIELRESTDPAITIHTTFAALLRGIKAGEFNRPTA